MPPLAMISQYNCCSAVCSTLQYTRHFIPFILTKTLESCLYHFHFTNEEPKNLVGLHNSATFQLFSKQRKLIKLSLLWIILKLSIILKDTMHIDHEIFVFYSPPIIINFNFKIVFSVSMIDLCENVC